MSSAATVLDLSELPNGIAHVSAAYCTTLAEATRVCLDDRGHPHPVDLAVGGSFRAAFVVRWEPATAELRRTYNDHEVATEHGAYGIAFMLIRRLTGLQVIEKSRKGTGFDYWLGADGDELPFQNKARLEVSGIRQGNPAKVAARVNQKRKQTKPSDASRLPAYVIVVEFGAPSAHVVKK